VNPLDELGKLLAMFPRPEPVVAAARYIPKTEAPEPYRRLLVHDIHMTEAMEAYHRVPVTVEVLNRRREGELYLREIVLRRADDGRPVQYGLVHFPLQFVSPEVRDEILEEKTPLGRVLINHDVMRHVDLGAILELTAGPGLAAALQMPVGGKTYGRLATLFFNHQPAIDLLEVSAPLSAGD
jgi:chorismate-pyruvate lyase